MRNKLDSKIRDQAIPFDWPIKSVISFYNHKQYIQKLVSQWFVSVTNSQSIPPFMNKTVSLKGYNFEATHITFHTVIRR
jgi:hypothetical protein